MKQSIPSSLLVWDVAQSAPELWNHLLEREPWVASELEGLRREIPIPPTNNAFETKKLFRPSGHFRAFYLHGPGDSVLAIKGGDLRCEDQQSFLHVMHERPFERHQRYSVLNALEYFLIQERKIPGALTFSEALTEAQRAAEVQSGFLRRFGELGGLPVPLLVVRWPPEVVADFRARLLPLLSGFSLEIAESELEGGLACYIYWFPKAPFPRVSHFAGALAMKSSQSSNAGYQQNTRLVYDTLQHEVDPEQVMNSWLTLVAKLLLLGYFPSDAQHFKNGQCIEPQNVLVNGSFADVDSVIPMRSLNGDREFYINFLVMLNLLVNTVRVFLLAENNGATSLPSPFPPQYQRPDFMEMLLVIHVWERLKSHLLELRQAFPVTLDPRLEEMVSSHLSFQVLFNKILFAIYYAGPQLPESVRPMLGITAAYDHLGPANGASARKAELAG
ncbi:hypothetical protein [Vitiosangium sp. GDMCC 1.1324]|uniref:hypothetical protein n=1 Tax=Vitiosangium sp. (strain GDMCC 1.1324) TaxID=2138576 RepID=UPI00130D6C55|nr:hypothetical protein [Vitiosangium sp. GDMCC 1.1324]